MKLILLKKSVYSKTVKNGKEKSFLIPEGYSKLDNIGSFQTGLLSILELTKG